MMLHSQSFSRLLNSLWSVHHSWCSQMVYKPQNHIHSIIYLSDQAEYVYRKRQKSPVVFLFSSNAPLSKEITCNFGNSSQSPKNSPSENPGDTHSKNFWWHISRKNFERVFVSPAPQARLQSLNLLWSQAFTHSELVSLLRSNGTSLPLLMYVPQLHNWTGTCRDSEIVRFWCLHDIRSQFRDMSSGILITEIWRYSPCYMRRTFVPSGWRHLRRETTVPQHQANTGPPWCPGGVLMHSDCLKHWFKICR